MERLRAPRPSEGSSLDTLHPLPGASSLPALLEAVSSPGVLQEEVDALLQGLARPLAANESPRARADFLLSVLEAREILSLKGSDGRTVHLATVEAMLDLGYPYALEVPPEAFAEVRRAHEDSAPRDIPLGGIAAALLALAAQALIAFPVTSGFLNSRHPNIPFGLFLVGATWGPSLSALLGGWLRWRGLQRLGIVTMALVGTGWLALSSLIAYPNLHDKPTTLVALVSGLSLVVGAVLLRTPEWRAKESAPPVAPDASTPEDSE